MSLNSSKVYDGHISTMHSLLFYSFFKSPEFAYFLGMEKKVHESLLKKEKKEGRKEERVGGRERIIGERKRGVAWLIDKEHSCHLNEQS